MEFLFTEECWLAWMTLIPRIIRRGFPVPSAATTVGTYRYRSHVKTEQNHGIMYHRMKVFEVPRPQSEDAARTLPIRWAIPGGFRKS